MNYSPIIFLGLSLTAALAAERDLRPDWMQDEPLVMAGSWEPPAHRARILERMDFLLPMNRIETYRREQSQATLIALKKLGVTTVLIPCYKGYGYQAERSGMEDAREFALLARHNGMRVGALIGESLGNEALLKERPEAAQWIARNPDGSPILADALHPWLYASVKNHPAFNDYLKRAVKFAVETMKADLVWFDDFEAGSASWDNYTTRHFQDHLADRNFAEARRTKLPLARAGTDWRLWQEWVRFRVSARTTHFQELTRYGQSMNRNCAMAANYGGVGASGTAASNGLMHSELLPLGQAFWAEKGSAGWKDGRTLTRIRSIKTGAAFNNATLFVNQTPLDLAENMAFNLNNIGMISWFENGTPVSANRGLSGPVSPYLQSYVDFYRRNALFYRRTTRAPDVAVLRTEALLQQGTKDEQQALWDAEQALIESQTPWAIVTEKQTGRLEEFKALIVPEDRRISPETKKELEVFRNQGGELVPAGLLVGDAQRARERIGKLLRVQVKTSNAVAVEVAERRGVPEVLVHMVNYNVDLPIVKIPVTIRPRRLTVPVSAEYWDPLQEKTVSLPITREGELLRFVVPRLNIYGVVVVRGAML